MKQFFKDFATACSIFSMIALFGLTFYILWQSQDGLF